MVREAHLRHPKQRFELRALAPVKRRIFQCSSLGERHGQWVLI
jgi:hypothetical protein